MRRKGPPRVVGPYQEKSRWRIVVVEQGKRKSFFCASREEALKLKADFARQVDLPPSRKLADVLTDWEQDKVRSGTCKVQSAQHQKTRLSLFLQPLLDEEITALTPRRAAALYERHTGQTSPAAWSHTVNTKSSAGASGAANSSQALLRKPSVAM